jgi:cGMP-dependent protein kinase
MSSAPQTIQHPESSTSAVIEEEKPEIEKNPESLKKRPSRKGKIRKQNTRTVAEARSAKILNRAKSKQDEELILRVLNTLPILKPLEETCKFSIINSMKWYFIEGKEMVYEEGNPASNMFIVHSGRLEIILNEARLGLLKQGDYFGEACLLDNSNRPSSVRTLEKTILWGIDRNTYKTILEEHSAKEAKETLEFIQSVPIFECLTEEQKSAVASSASIQNFSPDAVIITQGEQGDTLHIVKEGTVKVVINGNVLRTMAKGSFYGEQALIQRCPRTANIIAVTHVKVLVIGRDLFGEVFGSSFEEVMNHNSIRLCLDKTTLFKDKDLVNQIIPLCKVVKYAPGQVIIKKDVRKSKKLLIVIKGQLKSGEFFYGSYDVIGELEMNKALKDKYSEPLVAEVESVVAEISKKCLEKFTESRLSKFSTLNELMRLLPKVVLFRYFSNEKLKSLVKNLAEEAYSAGSTIITQGEIGDKLFIIKSGSVNIIKNGEIVRVLPAGSFFGERAILFNEPRSAGVLTNESSVLWSLDKSNFFKVVDQKMNEILIKRIELQDDSITLNDLIPIKVIGRGTHGIVYLCSHSSKKSLYALKSVTRQKISAFDLYENLGTERSILMKIDHLMIVKLVKTFKDNLRIYFLMEHVRGLDLFELISKVTRVSTQDCKFFMTCLLLILEFLHKNDIMYRDLKPENVIVDEEGYLKLIDFGSAKVVKGKTYTSLGTPHYMAPEIMTGTGYSNSVDWWSLGVLAFELLEGEVPFGPHEEDPMAIYDKIVQHDIQFNFTTAEARVVIQQLLNLKPALRNLGSVNKLKNHQFFQGVNWEQVILRQVKPSYIPKVPDVMNEVIRAFKAKKQLRDFMNREESQDVLVRQNTKPSQNINWDAEF